MNKKAELLLNSIVLLGIVALSIAYVENRVEDKVYLIDMGHNITYNLKSNSTSCQFDKIKVDSDKIKFAKTLKGVTGYTISSLCP